MINDLNRWTVGWIDWNLVLDEQGGPNHAGNYCSAPILAHNKTGTLEFQSSYYHIGHSSRFIRPGARRILCTTSQDVLEATAFVNVNGEIVIVVLNRSHEELPFSLKLDRLAAALESPAHSISTYVIPAFR